MRSTFLRTLPLAAPVRPLIAVDVLHVHDTGSDLAMFRTCPKMLPPPHPPLPPIARQLEQHLSTRPSVLAPGP
jgi:hypothetical protein